MTNESQGCACNHPSHEGQCDCAETAFVTKPTSMVVIAPPPAMTAIVAPRLALTSASPGRLRNTQ
ncbi:hypothetical protein [Streptomyces mirabilis]|uniref:hypothetical protein n=1 Tax=Streptomyces mirabilis TaxID=68239 RepID=UPI00380C76DD